MGYQNLKNKIHDLLTKRYSVIVIMVVATLLSGLDRNFGYFFGLFVVFFILRGSNYRWSAFGFGFTSKFKSAIGGLCIAVLLFIVLDIGIQPHLELYFGTIDLSSLDDVRGDPINYIMMTIIVWVFAAFGEELLFHGYYMRHLAESFGGSNRAWLIAGLFISTYFGISHAYQGPAGMIAVALAGLSHAFIFYKYRDRLLMLVFAHGFYDMIGLTLIYFSKEQMFLKWYQ